MQSGEDAVEAEHTLAEVNRLRDEARARAHGGAWLPAAAVAALLLGSIPLYRFPFEQTDAILAEYPFWAGLADEQRDPTTSYLFWFLGIPLLFALTAAWYRWRERRVGVRVPWWGFGAAGLGALAVLAILAAAPSGEPADGLTGGTTMWWPAVLTPLLPLAVGVVALGLTERSRGLVASGLWIALLAVWLCGTFPLGRVPGGMLSLRPGHYLVVMAAPLIVFAVIRLARARRASP
jgi:hypothetical protein